MSTEPPRQRDGQPFAGGKKLRKAMAKLKARQAAVPGAAKKAKFHTPGSMK